MEITTTVKIPEGYEPTGEYRVPCVGDKYLSRGGKLAYCATKMSSAYLILAKPLSETVTIEVSRALATRTHNATLKVLEDGKPITLSPTPDSAEWVAALNKAIRV
tara:strand:- start:100 stop:414 length:315 start_codon:yes stop_codon:yes gene_type:complete